MPIEPHVLAPFLLASILITILPGADMALVTRQVFLGGTRLAQRTTGAVLIAFGLRVAV